jgi:hypothetical protein
MNALYDAGPGEPPPNDPVSRARFEHEALQRFDRAAWFEWGAVLLSGFILSASLCALVAALLKPWLREPAVGLTVVAGAAAVVLWLPLCWALWAIDRWANPPPRRARLEKAFYQYLDLNYPLDPPQYRWEGSSTVHELLDKPRLREAALAGFAGGAVRFWHFYLATSFALASWLYLSWASMDEHAPTTALAFQFAAFSGAYLATRVAAWLMVQPCLPPAPATNRPGFATPAVAQIPAAAPPHAPKVAAASRNGFGAFVLKFMKWIKKEWDNRHLTRAPDDPAPGKHVEPNENGPPPKDGQPAGGLAAAEPAPDSHA